MNKTKTILSIAIASAIASPLSLQADEMTIYGSIGVAVEGIDSGNATAEVSNNHSAFGIKGAKNLEGDLKAVYLFDMFVGIDAGGGAGDDSLLGGGRDGWAGLAHDDWGIVALGFQGRPWKTSTHHLDMFGNTIADYSAIMGSTGDPSTYFDGGIGNSAIWFGPNIKGFSWHAQYGADESDDKTNDWGVQANYTMGDLYATVSYDLDGRGSADDVSAIKVAANYNMTGKIGVTGMFESLNGGDTNSRSAYYLAASYKMSKTTLKAAFAMANDLDAGSDTGATYIAIGASHKLADNVELYAIYSMINNTDNATYGYVSAPHTSSNGNTAVAAGDDTQVASVGFRYDFTLNKM